VCGSVTIAEPGVGDFPLGTMTLTHIATDESGLHASCTNTVTVIDTTPPVFDPSTLGARTVVGNCDGRPVDFAPPKAHDLCGTARVSCGSVAGNSLGANMVTCTATDDAGQTTTVTVVVTVLLPVHLAFDSPLADDNIADDPESDADVANVFNVNSVIRNRVRILSCDGSDVTKSVADQVTLRLTVNYRNTASTAAGTSIVPDFVGVGDAGGELVFTDGAFSYNQRTNRTDYPAGTVTSAYYFDNLVTLTYDSMPGVVIAREDARLESR
jgi:hypothetical protein